MRLGFFIFDHQTAANASAGASIQKQNWDELHATIVCIQWVFRRVFSFAYSNADGGLLFYVYFTASLIYNDVHNTNFKVNFVNTNLLDA